MSVCVGKCIRIFFLCLNASRLHQYDLIWTFCNHPSPSEYLYEHPRYTSTPWSLISKWRINTKMQASASCFHFCVYLHTALALHRLCRPPSGYNYKTLTAWELLSFEPQRCLTMKYNCCETQTKRTSGHVNGMWLVLVVMLRVVPDGKHVLVARPVSSGRLLTRLWKAQDFGTTYLFINETPGEWVLLVEWCSCFRKDRVRDTSDARHASILRGAHGILFRDLEEAALLRDLFA